MLVTAGSSAGDAEVAGAGFGTDAPVEQATSTTPDNATPSTEPTHLVMLI